MRQHSAAIPLLFDAHLSSEYRGAGTAVPVHHSSGQLEAGSHHGERAGLVAVPAAISRAGAVRQRRGGSTVCR